MSNQKKTDEEDFLAEIEKLLSEDGFNYDEEDFGYYSPHSSAGFNSDYGYDFELEEPPEIPKEAKKANRFCKHQNKIKKYLITSFYYYCPDCKNEVE